MNSIRSQPWIASSRAAVRRLPIFQDLSDDEARVLFEAARHLIAEEGEVILSPDAPPTGFTFLIAGHGI